MLRSGFRKLGGFFGQRRNSSESAAVPTAVVPSGETCLQRLRIALHLASWDDEPLQRLQDAAETVADAIVFLDRNKADLLFADVCRLVTEVLESFAGEQLTQLKLGIDLRLRASYLDLTAFVFDFENATDRAKELGCRKRVLRHFAANALQLRRDGSRFDGRYVVLTDIDDTLFPAGVLGGSDCSYLKKVRYPGMMSFFAALTGPELPVVALTARPPVLGQHTLLSLRRNRIFVHENTDRPFFLLYGRVADMVTAAVGTLSASARRWTGFSSTEQKSWYANIADTKFINYLEFSRVYPELDMVFVGDAGQGDLTAGCRMLKLGAFSASDPLTASRGHPVTEIELDVSASGDDVLPNPLRAVFVKEVVRQRFTGAIAGFFPDAHIRDYHETQHVLIFDNYVDAACASVRHGVAPLEAMRNVGAHAKDEIDSDVQKCLPGDRARLERYRKQIETSEDLLLSAVPRPTPRPDLSEAQLATVLSVDPADSITHPDEIVARQVLEYGLGDGTDSPYGSPVQSPTLGSAMLQWSGGTRCGSLSRSGSFGARSGMLSASGSFGDHESNVVPVVNILAAAGVISEAAAKEVAETLEADRQTLTGPTGDASGDASSRPSDDRSDDDKSRSSLLGPSRSLLAPSRTPWRPEHARKLSSEISWEQEKLMDEIVPILERAAAVGAETPDLVQMATQIASSLTGSDGAWLSDVISEAQLGPSDVVSEEQPRQSDALSEEQHQDSERALADENPGAEVRTCTNDVLLADETEVRNTVERPLSELSAEQPLSDEHLLSAAVQPLVYQPAQATAPGDDIDVTAAAEDETVEHSTTDGRSQTLPLSSDSVRFPP
eukprot:TRINITY_DN26852_c0_g1_i1.p1 TRINITY_DN26852_c0_g1~~TRINITY_DN26852_c0_g1_i1.p1  ORF type:complete len:837 (+),score=277.70 TRINITY_DN26852_c0_g1_i1:52-2562(+)